MNENPTFDHSNQSTFPVKEILAALEKKQRHTLVEFEYNGATYTVRVAGFALAESHTQSLGIDVPDSDDDEKIKQPQEYRSNFRIHNSDGVELGKINGLVKIDGDQFIEYSLLNFHSENKEVPNVPGIVRESIMQLIIEKAFQVWYSSTSHTAGGLLLYKNLIEDSRVTSNEKITEGKKILIERVIENGEERWKLTPLT